jgi:hypothetical protein
MISPIMASKEQLDRSGASRDLKIDFVKEGRTMTVAINKLK